MGMFLILESKVIHGVILIEPATFNTLHHFLRVHVVLLVQDVHNGILNQQALTLKVNEMRPSRLIGHTEFTGPQLPQSDSMLRFHKNGSK